MDVTATFYGALLAGRTPCPIAPPGSFERLERYRDTSSASYASLVPAWW